jgi:hypothetical protein
MRLPGAATGLVLTRGTTGWAAARRIC